MKNDLLKQYTQLRDALVREKGQLEARLREITAALGTEKAPETAPETAPAAPATRRRGRGKNALSLKEAIIQVTSKQPMDRHQILEAVEQLGYRFNSKAPLNSLGTILYGKKPKFLNANGKFSPLGLTDTSRAPQAGVSAPPAAKPKRKLSRKGRANIIAAAKARWARVHAAQKA